MLPSGFSGLAHPLFLILHSSFLIFNSSFLILHSSSGALIFNSSFFILNSPPLSGTSFATVPKTTYMEKRMFGIILTILGIIGLIMAAYGFMNGSGGGHGVKSTIIYAVLGAI